jgi:formylglycine-generating enzyme required for sulfatase activity
MMSSLIPRCVGAAVLLFVWISSARPDAVGERPRMLHAPGGGTVRAVVIGINKYPNLSDEAQLHGAVADALDISATLKAVGVAGDNVRTLIDGAAVRSRVIDVMNGLVSESKSGDLAIIAYSGYGMRVAGYKRWDGQNLDALHAQIALSNFSPTVRNGHEIIVDGEMRAWYSRLDAKGVDVLVVMDTSFAGQMRQLIPVDGGVRVRAIPVRGNGPIDDMIRDSFEPIPHTETEVRMLDSNEMRHVTFFGAATEESRALEMSGIDRNDRTAVRGALSYFMARAFEGAVLQDGKVTRTQLFRFIRPNVRAVTGDRQFIDFGPRTEDEAALLKIAFRVEDRDGQPLRPCMDILAAFDKAWQEHAPDSLRSVTQIDQNPECRARFEMRRGKLVDFLIEFAGVAEVAAADRARALDIAERILENIADWQGAARLGDYYLSHGDPLKALHWYQQSAAILTTPGVTATDKERKDLAIKQEAAQAMASSDPQSRRRNAERRVALVVGNAAYRHADRLPNPVNDAQDMRDALDKLGFDVIYGEDLDQTALRRAIGQFAGRVADADVAIVYFAGHGATFGDTPYVVPVDAQFSSLEAIPYELVPVEMLIRELRRAKGVRIAILDACRDNDTERVLKWRTLRARDVTGGLGPVKNTDGLIVAYATQYLSTAADGIGRNSPFTAAVLKNIATPGLDVKDLFARIERDVVAATEKTGKRQRPEISVSMDKPYALVPAAAVPAEPRVRPLSADEERRLQPRDGFRECENCPEMVVVPTGSFTMGSPEGENGRESEEGPQRVVTIAKPFAVGRLHVTVDQFAAFVAETRYDAGSTCVIHEGDRREAKGSWRNPGFAQDGSHPAVCLSWDDASAYVNWLARKTGKPYRLLSEAEWEYAARGRTSPGAYPRFGSGDDETDLCRHGNGADQKARDIGWMKDWTLASCNDGYAYTSPAGHYEPNAFGLYDMAGNAWQWTADCYHDGYRDKEAPADGSAWTAGSCGNGRVSRGGSWSSVPSSLRPARRGWNAEGNVHNDTGLRLARTLAVSPLAVSPAP